jgi:TRAP transporter TAXI family solute receptor
MKRAFIAALALLATACSRGPDHAALEKQVQGQIEKGFKPGLLELAVLKRQGSSPQPAAEGGAERVLVYYNATLRLKEGYDFKDWEGMSPATLAQVLGAREKGVLGVKAKENQPGDLLYVYGSGTFEQSAQGWVAVAGNQRDVSPAPADPGNAAAAPSSKRYLDQLAAVVSVGPAGMDPQSEAIISEELEHALRAIQRRRARANELVTIASGPSTGEYARVVEAVLANLRKGGRRSRALSVETEGSIENALLVGRGQADYAMIQSDVAWLAATGAGPFAVDGPLARLAALGSLYPEPVHIVVAAKSAIRSVDDLRGKRVDLGTPQSGTRINALSVLQANRIAARELAEARGDGPQAALHALRAGRIDAFFSTVGAPARELQRVAATFPIRLVPISGPAASRLIAEQPGLVQIRLPANTYPGQSEPVATVAATALLVGSVDTPADEVKVLLQFTYETTDYLAFGSAQGVKISKKTGLRGIAIPLHPAAADYFGTVAKKP